MNPLASSILLILAAMFSIQYGASIAKQLFPLAGPAGTTALRVSISALILVLAARVWKHKISLRHFPAIAAYGLSLGSMNLLFYLALQRIPLGIAVALEFVGPLSVALLSSKKIVDLFWAFLAALGIYLIMPASAASEHLDLTGVLLALGAGIFWALYIVFGKSTIKTENSLVVTAWGMVFAALLTLPFGVAFNREQITNVSILPMAVLVAILSSALPYSLEMKAMRNMSAKTFGIFMSMEPAVAALMGFLFLHESLNGQQWSAIACVMIASAGSTLTHR